MAGQPFGAAEGVEVPAQVSFLVCGGNLSRSRLTRLYFSICPQSPASKLIQMKPTPHLLTHALLWGFS